MSTLSAVLVVVAVACLLVVLLLLGLAGRWRREVRSSIFPIVREEGVARVWRARLGATVAAVMAAVAAVAFLASDQTPLPVLQVSLPDWPQLVPEVPQLAQANPTDAPTPEPTNTRRPSPEPTATSPATPSATLSVPAAPATGAVSATPTLAPATVTRTPAPTATSTLASSPTAPRGTPISAASPTRRPSPVALPANMKLGPLTFAQEVDPDRNAVNPTLTFSNTVNRVYAVFPFAGMRKGLLWTQVWYFNGMEFAREDQAWEWGVQDRSFVFMKPVGAGEYRLDLLVNNQLQTSGKFTVLGPTAIGGPTNP